MLIAIGVGVGVLMAVALMVVVRQRWRQAAMGAGQALLAATEIGDLAQMQTLLAQRIDINARNVQGWTSLHLAASSGDIALVELLLRYGADVNAPSNVGATPLDHAITYGRKKEVAELLSAHGASGHTTWDSIF